MPDVISPNNGELQSVVHEVFCVNNEIILTSISGYLCDLIYLLQMREENPLNERELNEIVAEQKALNPEFFEFDDIEDGETFPIPENETLRERFVKNYNSMAEVLSRFHTFPADSYQFASIYFQLVEYCRRKAFSNRNEVSLAKEQLIQVKNIVDLRCLMCARFEQ